MKKMEIETDSSSAIVVEMPSKAHRKGRKKEEKKVNLACRNYDGTMVSCRFKNKCKYVHVCQLWKSGSFCDKSECTDAHVDVKVAKGGATPIKTKTKKDKLQGSEKEEKATTTRKLLVDEEFVPITTTSGEDTYQTDIIKDSIENSEDNITPIALKTLGETILKLKTCISKKGVLDTNVLLNFRTALKACKTRNLSLLNDKLSVDIMSCLRPVFEWVVYPGPKTSSIGFKLSDVEDFNLVIEQLSGYNNVKANKKAKLKRWKDQAGELVFEFSQLRDILPKVSFSPMEEVGVRLADDLDTLCSEYILDVLDRLETMRVEYLTIYDALTEPWSEDLTECLISMREFIANHVLGPFTREQTCVVWNIIIRVVGIVFDSCETITGLNVAISLVRIVEENECMRRSGFKNKSWIKRLNSCMTMLDRDLIKEALPKIEPETMDALESLMIGNFYDLSPSIETYYAKEKIFYTLQSIFKKRFKVAKLHMYGSSASNCSFKYSDFDLCLSLPNNKKTGRPVNPSKVVWQLKACLADHGGFSGLMAIDKARVPIVKLIHTETSIECDVCINNSLGVINSKLLRCYIEYDERARVLIFNVKYWTKQRSLASASDGTFSSYSWVLLCIFYLQNTSPPVLPVLQSNLRQAKKDTAHHKTYDGEYDIRFHEFLPLAEKNTESHSELFLGFLYFYSCSFNKKIDVVSIRTGRILQKRDVWEKPLWWRFSIEDPFETTDHDLGVVLQKRGQDKILTEFTRALNLIKQNRVDELWAVPETKVSENIRKRRRRFKPRRK